MEKIYLVMMQYSTDESDGVETEAFDSYEKAIKHFKDAIQNEITCEDYWTANAFENGKLGHNYELDCSPNYNDGEEHELWWYISCKMDWCLHTFIELRILEVQ